MSCVCLSEGCKTRRVDTKYSVTGKAQLTLIYEIVETSHSRCWRAVVQRATGYDGTAAAAAAKMRMEKRENGLVLIWQRSIQTYDIASSCRRCCCAFVTGVG